MTKWYSKPVLLPERELCNVLLNPKLSYLEGLRLKDYIKLHSTLGTNQSIKFKT